MQPTREEGDDRVMWRVRPLMELPGTSTRAPLSGWCYVESAADVADMIEDCDVGHTYEVGAIIVSAETWNNMPEFEGW